MRRLATRLVTLAVVAAAAQGCTKGSGAPAAAQVPGEVVVQAGWGSDPSSLGRAQPDEGSPEAPMSFDVDAKGRLYVLDQVNGRIEVIDPSGARSAWPLPSFTYQDIAVSADGTVAALDRFTTKGITFFDASGAATATVPLAAVDDPGLVTALVRTANDTFVEVDNETLVRVADAHGGAAAASTLPGRPTLDGQWLLSAEIAGSDSVRVTRLHASDPTGAPAASSMLSFAIPVATIDALESDAKGRAFVGVTVHPADLSADDPLAGQHSFVVVLDTAGNETTRFEIATPTTADEQFRSLRVTPDGKVYQLDVADSGTTIRRYAP